VCLIQFHSSPPTLQYSLQYASFFETRLSFVHLPDSALLQRANSVAHLHRIALSRSLLPPGPVKSHSLDPRFSRSTFLTKNFAPVHTDRKPLRHAPTRPFRRDTNTYHISRPADSIAPYFVRWLFICRGRWPLLVERLPPRPSNGAQQPQPTFDNVELVGPSFPAWQLAVRTSLNTNSFKCPAHQLLQQPASRTGTKHKSGGQHLDHSLQSRGRWPYWRNCRFGVGTESMGAC
jgi:hypothetical protein